MDPSERIRGETNTELHTRLAASRVTDNFEIKIYATGPDEWIMCDEWILEEEFR